MKQIALPDRTAHNGIGDAAMALARRTEDVVVGDEIVRERLSARVVHWAVALTFFVCLFTGLPIWTPYLGFLASLSAACSIRGRESRSPPPRCSCSCNGFPK